MKSAFIYGTPDFSAIEKAAQASENEETRMSSIQLVGQRNKFQPNSSLKSSEKRQRQILLVYLGPAKKQKKINEESANKKTVKISVIKMGPTVLQKMSAKELNQAHKRIQKIRSEGFPMGSSQWIITILKVNKITEYILKSEFWIKSFRAALLIKNSPMPSTGHIKQKSTAIINCSEPKMKEYEGFEFFIDKDEFRRLYSVDRSNTDCA